jgi:hypothetical protein
MVDDDLPEAARHATAANILQCLTMLAEEAVNLNLPRTMLALRKAIRACQAEQARPFPKGNSRSRSAADAKDCIPANSAIILS